MLLRERLRSAIPGLFPQRPLQLATPRFQAARVAAANLYGGTFPGGLVVPSLDHPSPAGTRPVDEMSDNPFLFAPVWRIAFRLGALPMKVYRFTSEAEREEARDHGAYKILRHPNDDISPNLLMSGTVLSMFLDGACGWLKERENPNAGPGPKNPIVAVWPIPGNTVSVVRGENRIIESYVLRVQGFPTIPLSRDDVCYFRLMPDPKDWAKGTSPSGPLGHTLDFGNEAISTMTELFQTAFLQRIWIDLNGADLEEDQLNRLRSEMEIARRSRFGVPIMESGAKIESMGTYGSTVEDALLGRAVDLAEKVVKHTFGLPDDSDNLAMFYGEVIQPVADAIEKELERSFMPEFEGEAFPEFQFREILAGSPKDRAELHQKKILSGQETPNEARRAENLKPLEGGDELLVPLNVGPLIGAGKVGESPKKDSSGGLGGDEGRDIIPKTPMPKAAMGDSADSLAIRQQLARTARENWKTIRDGVLSGQGDALERRLRGAMRKEHGDIHTIITGDKSLAAPVVPISDLDQQVFDDKMRLADEQVAQLLTGFNIQIASEAWRQAANFMKAETGELDPQVEALIVKRAKDMSEAFGLRRREELISTTESLRQEEKTLADLDGVLREIWEGLANHLVRSIGLNEVSWAFDQGAAYSWSQAGYGQLGIVRGDKECRTGACDAAANGTYGPSELPTPIHPGCVCYVVPAPFVE